MIITEKEFNIQTGKETITERDETVEEAKARLDYAKEIAAAQAAAVTKAEAKEAARQALLDKLGINADELKLLLG